MSKLREAAQALGDRISDLGASPLDWPEYAALLSALAEPEQEPVAWIVYWGQGLARKHSVHFERETADLAASEIKSFQKVVRPLYAPPDIAKLTAERDALAHDLVIERARKTIVEQERDALMQAAVRYKVVRDTLTARLNALEAAAKLALNLIDNMAHFEHEGDPEKPFSEAIEALKKAGVTP